MILNRKLISTSALAAVIFMISLLVTSCFPAPWTCKNYMSDLPQITLKAPFDQPGLSPYKISSEFLYVAVRPDDPSGCATDSKYKIQFRLLKGAEEIDSAKIHSVSILVNKKEIKNFSIRDLERDNLLFPSSLTLNETSEWRRSYFVTSVIDLDHASDKEIEVITDIEITKAGRSNRKSITYKFQPTTEKGLFQWIEV